MFEPERVYVIEFWSTWCAACLESIPALNKLAAEHASNATFVALHIWPSETALKPREFIQKRRDAKLPFFDFAVGIDSKGEVAREWMDATFNEGLPTAMIIDRQSRLVWFGDAREVDRPLREVLQGTNDVVTDTARMKRSMRVGALGKESGAAIQRKEYARGIQLIQEAWREDPDLVSPWLPSTYGHLLATSQSSETAQPFAQWLLESETANRPDVLAGTANAILHFKPPELRDLDLALRLAIRAREADPSADVDLVILLARLHAEKGDRLRAAMELKSAWRNAMNDKDRSALGRALEGVQSAPGD
jgi:thiol-disulfide isomerase/thioredoxin